MRDLKSPENISVLLLDSDIDEEGGQCLHFFQLAHPGTRRFETRALLLFAFDVTTTCSKSRRGQLFYCVHDAPDRERGLYTEMHRFKTHKY